MSLLPAHDIFPGQPADTANASRASGKLELPPTCTDRHSLCLSPYVLLNGNNPFPGNNPKVHTQQTPPKERCSGAKPKLYQFLPSYQAHPFHRTRETAEETLISHPPEKNLKKNRYICITESLFCTPETNTTL